MAERSAFLHLTIISVADLKRKWLSGCQTTALAWVDPSEKRTTSMVGSNGANVQWPPEKLILRLNGFDNSSESKLLTIEIHARGTWGNSILGSVYVPLIELASDGEKSGHTILMYQIVKPSGKRQGSMKFFAKVVQPRLSVASAEPRPSAPPMPLLEDAPSCSGSDVVYPPASVTGDVETNNERPSSEANLPHPYPPQPPFVQNDSDRHDGWQHNMLANASYGMGSTYPPYMHPPVNMIYPLPTSPPNCWPQSNYTGNTPYPPSSIASVTPYPPPTSVYPPPTTFSEAPYPPIAPSPQLPQVITQHPSQVYASVPFLAYSNCSSPLDRPFYGQQLPTIHYH